MSSQRDGGACSKRTTVNRRSTANHRDPVAILRISQSRLFQKRYINATEALPIPYRADDASLLKGERGRRKNGGGGGG